MCRYDGFNQALQTAAANITDAATELTSPRRSQTPVASPTARTSAEKERHEKKEGLTKDALKTGFKVS